MSTFQLSRKSRTTTTHRHRAHQGLCTTCGSVWPCYRDLRANVPAAHTARVAPVLF
jgi:hypothetical protein